MVMVMTKAKHLDVTQARSALSPKQASSGENTTPLSILFAHGSIVVEVYQPVTTDHQKPHDRDECDVIIEGHGNFEMGDEIISFGLGDFLFVLAGLPHRFIDFGDTMSTWVMFMALKVAKTPTALKKPAKHRQFHSYSRCQAALETDQHDAIKLRLLRAIRGLIHAAHHQRQYAQDS